MSPYIPTVEVSDTTGDAIKYTAGKQKNTMNWMSNKEANFCNVENETI